MGYCNELIPAQSAAWRLLLSSQAFKADGATLQKSLRTNFEQACAQVPVSSGDIEQTLQRPNRGGLREECGGGPRVPSAGVSPA